MSGQIHPDFLRLLWVLADKQLRTTMRAWARRIRSEMRLLDGRGPRFSTPTRLQLVGPLFLAAPPAVICLYTVLRCLGVTIPAIASASVLHSAAVGGSVVGVVRPL